MISKVNGVLGAVLASTMLVLIFHTKQAMAIECYQCNSEFDPRCGDPFDPYSLGQINCSLKTPAEHLVNITATLCRKTVQKVYGKVRVIRECGYILDEERDDKACVRRSGTHNVFVWYCSCTGDLCNAGTSHWANDFVIITALFASILATRNSVAGRFISWSL